MNSTQPEFREYMLSTVPTTPSETHDEEHSSSPSFTIPIDDQGDIILAAGPFHLRVSSNILRVASPVFRAMLQPGRYLEGQTSRDSAKPCTVKLEEDDPDVLVALCSILHFKKVVFLPDIARLAAFADLCDKYQCARASLYHVMHWLIMFKNIATTDQERVHLLWITYTFGIEDEFNLASRELIKHLSVVGLANLRIHDRLPDSVKGRWA